MGLAKDIYTRRNMGEKINYDPKPKNTVLNGTWNVVQIPEGIMDINEINKPIEKVVKRANVKKQVKIIKELEKQIKKKVSKPKTLVKTASINDIQKALGKKYIVERDRNYKCRRWVVTNGKKEWHIRYNDPLILAISYIERYGAVKFLKEYTMKSKYN